MRVISLQISASVSPSKCNTLARDNKGAALAGELWVDRLGGCRYIVSRLSAYASTQPHAYAYGGAAQLEVALPVSVSWPSVLHCYLCLTHCSPSKVPNPTPGPLMSTPLVWSANSARRPSFLHSRAGATARLLPLAALKANRLQKSAFLPCCSAR